MSESQATQNVRQKIEALENFCETKRADFILPKKKFGLNWFLAWEDPEKGLSATSKSLDAVRVGGCLKERLNAAIEDCNEVLDAIQKLDPKKETELTKLKAENSDLKKKLRRLAQDVYELMIENEEYRKRAGVEQAEHRDKQKTEWMANQGG